MLGFLIPPIIIPLALVALFEELYRKHHEKIVMTTVIQEENPNSSSVICLHNYPPLKYPQPGVGDIYSF